MPVRTQLASWNRAAASTTSILSFVRSVTTPSSSSYVHPEDRVAVLDSDGTLWCEQPAPPLAFFAMYRLRELDTSHDALAHFDSRLTLAARAGDIRPFGDLSISSLSDLVLHLENGCTPEDFIAGVHRFLRSDVHPRFRVPFAQLTYKPMLELLRFLEGKQFRTFVITGGSVEFLRAASEGLYGLPPERVTGRVVDYVYEQRESQVVITRTGTLLGDGGEGDVKVRVIVQQIGRRPILVVGNSAGDRQMLDYTDSGCHASLCLLVQHDDRVREYEYPLDDDLATLAAQRGWQLISMRRDFRRVFSGRVRPRAAHTHLAH